MLVIEGGILNTPSQKEKELGGEEGIVCTSDEGQTAIGRRSVLLQIHPPSGTQNSRTRGGEGFFTQNGLTKVKGAIFQCGTGIAYFFQCCYLSCFFSPWNLMASELFRYRRRRLRDHTPSRGV